MTSLILPNDIINLTPADATAVQQNFSVIEQYVNAEVITRDGSVAMTAPLELVGDPTQGDHAANKDYVDAILPVGIILPYGGTTSPAGDWAVCNGASLARASYPELFAVLGTRFGTAAAGAFLLPNLKGRVPIGVDTAQGDINVSGDSGGTTVPPLKTHTHGIDHNHPEKTTTPANVGHTHTIDHNHPERTTSPADQGHTHTIDHDHPSYTTPSGGGHSTHQAHFINQQAGTGAGSFVAVPHNVAFGLADDILTATDGLHTHVIDLPVTSGLVSGNHSQNHTHTVDLPTTTGLISGSHSQNHTHTVNPDTFVGESQTPTQAVDAAYRPPFLALVYIIRVR